MSLTSKQANQAVAAVSIGDEVHRATGSGAISETITIDRPTMIIGVQLHLDAAGQAENFSVALDSAAGDAYDTILLSQDMDGVSDLNSTDAIPVAKGDNIVITFANTGAATYGLTLHYANG